MIPASDGSTPPLGLEKKRQIDVNIDHSSSISGHEYTGQVTDLAEASETTPALRQSERVRKALEFFSPGLNYVKYIDTGEYRAMETSHEI